MSIRRNGQISLCRVLETTLRQQQRNANRFTPFLSHRRKQIWTSIIQSIERETQNIQHSKQEKKNNINGINQECKSGNYPKSHEYRVNLTFPVSCVHQKKWSNLFVTRARKHSTTAAKKCESTHAIPLAQAQTDLNINHTINRKRTSKYSALKTREKKISWNRKIQRRNGKKKG